MEGLIRHIDSHVEYLRDVYVLVRRLMLICHGYNTGATKIKKNVEAPGHRPNKGPRGQIGQITKNRGMAGLDGWIGMNLDAF